MKRSQVIGFERADAEQEFELGRLQWIRKHPECPDGMRNGYPEADLKGYKRLIFYRRRQARWANVRTRLVEQVVRSDYKVDFESMLIREILALLPYTVRGEVLRALASADGRKIRKAARLVRETCPELVEEKQPEAEGVLV